MNEEKRNAYRILGGGNQKKKTLGRQRRRWWIILKWILEIQDEVVWTGWI
jgi:hypothetical protein